VVDADDNPKLVKIYVNKAVSGMAKRLTRTLKGTGFSRVEILLDDGTVVDSFTEEEAAPVPAAGAAPPPPPPPPPAPPAPEAVAAAAAATKGQLAGLIPLINQVTDPALKAELGKLARQATVNLQTGNPTYAAAAAEQLRRALLAAGLAPGAPKPAEGSVVRLAQGMLLWNSMRAHIDGQLKTLQTAIVAQSQGEPDFAEIKAGVGSLSVVLEHLDDRLTEKLNALRATTDPATKQKVSEEAREIVRGYRDYVQTDPLMADIDDNGFVPLDVRARAEETLRAIMAMI